MTDPPREIHFNAEDTNIQRAGTLSLGLKDGGRQRGDRGGRGLDSHCMY